MRPTERGGLSTSLARVEHVGPQAEGPPATIMSQSSFDTIDWLTW